MAIRSTIRMLSVAACKPILLSAPKSSNPLLSDGRSTNPLLLSASNSGTPLLLLSASASGKQTQNPPVLYASASVKQDPTVLSDMKFNRLFSSAARNYLLLLSARKQSPPVLSAAGRSTSNNDLLLLSPFASADEVVKQINRPMFSSVTGIPMSTNDLLLLSASATGVSTSTNNLLLLSACASSDEVVKQINRPLFTGISTSTKNLLLLSSSAPTGKHKTPQLYVINLPLLSAGSLVFNYPLRMPPILSLPAAGVRGFAGRPGGYPSDGAFMCFACYNENKSCVVFDSPGALETHYEVDHPEIPGPPCRCGASFPAEENKHGCVLRENETFEVFRERMRKDKRRFGKKMYKCPVRGCKRRFPSPLKLHLHHLKRH